MSKVKFGFWILKKQHAASTFIQTHNLSLTISVDTAQRDCLIWNDDLWCKTHSMACSLNAAYKLFSELNVLCLASITLVKNLAPDLHLWEWAWEFQSWSLSELFAIWHTVPYHKWFNFTKNAPFPHSVIRFTAPILVDYSMWLISMFSPLFHGCLATWKKSNMSKYQYLHLIRKWLLFLLIYTLDY